MSMQCGYCKKRFTGFLTIMHHMRTRHIKEMMDPFATSREIQTALEIDPVHLSLREKEWGEV